MRELTSREYQCQLPITLIQRDGPSTILDLFTYLDCSVPPFHLVTYGMTEKHYTEFFYDTATYGFQTAGYFIRVRRSRERIRYAFKATARDRCLVEEAPIKSDLDKAETRFEENIYPFYSLYTRMTSVDIDKDQDEQIESVHDLAEIFPGARIICSDGEKLQVTSQREVDRQEKFYLALPQSKAEACLELKYSSLNDRDLCEAEFSWRYQSKSGEKFDTEELRAYRHLLNALAQSKWIDISVEQEHCQQLHG